MRTLFFTATVLFVLLFSTTGNAQIKIGDNPTTIGASSLLELEATNKGIVFPRMTGAQMNAIASPVSGMFIFNTDSLCLCHYNGTAWRSLCGGNTGSPFMDWHITGNTGTIASTAAIGAAVNNNFIGTTDARDFVMAANNLERIRITTNGRVGIGITNPFTNLNVRRFAAVAPTNSGIATGAILRLDASNNALDIGAYPAAPFGNWLQATTVTDLSAKYPIVLNPNGGYIGIGVAAPANRLEIVNDGGASAEDDNIAIKSYGTTLNPQIIFQTAAGTLAAPTNLSNGSDLGSLNWVGQVNGASTLLSKISSTLTGSGTDGKSDFKLTTSGIEHMRIDSIGRVMLATNTTVFAPKTSLHMYGDGTSGYALGGTTIVPNPAEGPEIAFGRGGFNTNPGAAIQFIDYNSYSGGLAFLVHKGQANNGGGAFADNWPLDVIEAMTIVNNGQIGIGTSDPKAKLHIIAGSAAAESAPLKFTSGVNSQTTKEAGAVNYDGTDLTLSDATYAYTLTKTLNGSASLDFAAATAATVSNLTITVTGAAVGDPVILGIPNAAITATATYTAWVSAANTVTVRFSPKANENPAAATFNVRVIK